MEEVIQEQVEYPRFKATTLPFAAMRGAILGLLAGVCAAYIQGASMFRIEQQSVRASNLFGSWLWPGDWATYFYEWLAHVVSIVLQFTPGLERFVFSNITFLRVGLVGWENAGDFHRAGQLLPERWLLENQHAAWSIMLHYSVYGALFFVGMAFIRWAPSMFGIEFMNREAVKAGALYVETKPVFRFAFVVAGAVTFALFVAIDAGGNFPGIIAFILMLSFDAFYPVAGYSISFLIGIVPVACLLLFAKLLGIEWRSDSKVVPTEHLRGADILSAEDLSNLIRNREQ